MNPILDIDSRVFKPPELGTLLYYPGLPGAGSKIYDRSLYVNNGTITGATWVKSPLGVWCLSFDGTDDKVDAGRIVPFETPPWTIMMWFNLRAYGVDASTYPTLLFKATTWTHGVWLYWFQTQDILRVRFYGVGGVNKTFFPTPLNTWHQVALTLAPDKRTLTCYINGSSRGTATADADFLPSTNNCFIGGGYSNTYDGLIALPRLIYRDLTALEVRRYFDQEKHLFGVW